MLKNKQLSCQNHFVVLTCWHTFVNKIETEGHLRTLFNNVYYRAGDFKVAFKL